MKEIQQHYDKLRSLFENALDVVIAMDINGNISGIAKLK